MSSRGREVDRVRPVMVAALVALVACSDAPRQGVPAVDGGLTLSTAAADSAGTRVVLDSTVLGQKAWYEGLDSLAPNPLPGPVSDWVTRVDGIGPLVAGMSLSTARAALGFRLGTVDASEGCDFTYLQDGPAGLSFMVESGRVVRVDVDSSLIATDRGIRVGDTEADVRRVYGAWASSRNHPYDAPEWHYLVVRSPRDTLYGLIFETDGSRVRSYRVGLWAQVQYIEGCS